MCNNNNNNRNGNGGCGCRDDIDVERVCAECIIAKKAKIHKIVANDICAQTAEINTLSVQNETANNLCVPGMIQAAQVLSVSSNSNSLCAASANIGTACISNLTVSNFLTCVKYRAAVTSAVDTTYVLGTPINWTVILDDPNNSVALSPFSYTVPVSGYYLINFNIESANLAGAATITGIPVSLLTVLVNGTPLIQQQAPFLSFSQNQYANLSSLVLLNSGDIVTMTYNVLVQDPVLGLSNYVGTMTIEANGQFAGESGFAIHYQSSLVQPCSVAGAPPVCAACPPVVIPCSSVITPCMPLGQRQPGMDEDPCESCQ